MVRVASRLGGPEGAGGPQLELEPGGGGGVQFRQKQQAAQERPVAGAGQQQVLVGAGTVDIGKLAGDAERIR